MSSIQPKVDIRSLLLRVMLLYHVSGQAHHYHLLQEDCLSEFATVSKSNNLAFRQQCFSTRLFVPYPATVNSKSNFQHTCTLVNMSSDTISQKQIATLSAYT